MHTILHCLARACLISQFWLLDLYGHAIFETRWRPCGTIWHHTHRRVCCDEDHMTPQKTDRPSSTYGVTYLLDRGPPLQTIKRRQERKGVLVALPTSNQRLISCTHAWWDIQIDAELCYTPSIPNSISQFGFFSIFGEKFWTLECLIFQDRGSKSVWLF
jgi:hypothetical protein